MKKTRQAMPPLPALQAFESAARHENFMSAARELNISQSAVSHRVRALEQYLGYALFERLPRGLRLTENGKAYLQPVRNAFSEILGATSSIFGLNKSARLTVRAPLSYTALWLSGIVGAFSLAYPHIEVRMESSVWAEALVETDIDIEIRLGHGHWPGCRAELLFREELVPACAPATLATDGMLEDTDMLKGRPLVHVIGAEDQWRNFFRHNLDDMQPYETASHIYSDSSLAAAEIAATSRHYCLLARRFVDHHVESGRLVQVGSKTIMSTQGIYLLTQETSEPVDPEVDVLKKWIRDYSRPV